MLGFTKSKRVFFRWFLSLLVFFTITMVIVSTWLYRWYSKDNEKIYYEMFTTNLQQTAGIMEMLDNSIKNIGFDMLQDPNISTVMYSKKSNYLVEREVNQKLIKTISINPIIHSIYIVNKNASWITGTPSENINVAEYHEHINNLVKNRRTDAIIKIDTHKTILQRNKEKDRNLISYVFYQNRYSSSEDSFLVINIEEADLTSTMVKMYPIEGNDIYIIDLKGKVVLTHDKQKLYNEMGNFDYIQSILKSAEKSGYLSNVFIEDKGASLITFVDSKKLGYKLLSITPNNIVKMSSRILMIKTLKLTFIIFFIGLIISAILTRSLYLPLSKLIKKYIYNIENPENRNNHIIKYKDEFEILDTILENSNAMVVSMDDFINKNIPIIRQEYLRSILAGRINLQNETTQDKLIDLGINFKHGVYQILYIKISNLHEFKQQMKNLIFEKISHQMEHLFKDICNCNILTETGVEDELVCVLSYEKNSNKLSQRVMEASEYFVEKAAEENISICIAMGKESTDNISDSYNNACELLNYRIKYGERCILHNEKIKKNILKDELFPNNDELELIKALKKLSVDESKIVISNIIENFYNYSYNDIIRALLNILHSTFQHIKDISSSESLVINFDFYKEYNILLNSSSLKDMEYKLQVLYENIILELKKGIDEQVDTHKVLMEHVLKYTSENFLSPSISIQVVAEYVGLSSSYLGKIFKNHTGVYFTEYVNTLKLEKAKVLLKETTYNLSEISKKIGFNSSSYFVTCFKNYTGLTPTKYRNRN